MSSKSTLVRKEDVQPHWHLVDAEGKILGRLASRVARVLQGKHKPDYTPHVDHGDFVVVVNASKIGVTGRKKTQKVYRKYTGYAGGLKEVTLGKMLERKPEVVIRKTVERMMPKTRLGIRMGKKLKVYAGPEHPHSAQRPEPLKLG